MTEGINLNFSNTDSPLPGTKWVNMSQEKRVHLVKSAIDSFSSSADITVIDAHENGQVSIVINNLINVNELTSRLPQTGIKSMMDRLSLTYNKKKRGEVIDACLASNIIEVGVDIDRLSLMGVIGQPKTTSTYIQVTGRVGRRWWERPGLVLMLYSSSKSRDISHFEQFHSYHRRLYEFVEPTSATPFAIPAIKRGLVGALLSWARQFSNEDVKKWEEYEMQLLRNKII